MWIFGVSGWITSNTRDVLMDAFSMSPFPCEGFRNLLRFSCVPPKALNVALEWHRHLYVNSNKAHVAFEVGHDLSQFLWILAAFPYWKRIFVCKSGIAVLYLILLYSWESPAKRLPGTWEHRSATVDLPAHLCQWRIISFFDECYILQPTFHPSKARSHFSINFFSSS